MSTLRRVTEDARDARVSGASSLVAGMAIHGQADSAGGTEPLRRSFITSRRWYRAVLPLMMVIYASEVIPSPPHVRGGRFIVVVAVLIVFCLLYLVAMFRVAGDRRSVMWTILGVMIACNVAELILVGGSAMIMWMLLVAPLIIRYKLRSAPVIVGVVVLSYVLPFLEPRWRMAGDLSIPAQILSVSLLVL
jgi:hypothetical protein